MTEAAASLLMFSAAAIVLTVTPGLDTAIVLRAAATDAKRGLAAALGVLVGCSFWGAAATAGAAAMFAASTAAYAALKIAGATYLAYVGLKLLLKRPTAQQGSIATLGETSPSRWLRRGLYTNLLNPKVGLFYAAFLPQFVPEGSPVGLMMAAITVIHISAGAFWFAGLIFAAQKAAAILRRPIVTLWLDRALGAAFVALASKLALSARP
jgi:threonine/homoserine/homoserine lactone efflux protein